MSSSWKEKDPEQCCNVPDFTEDRTVNEGDKIIVYSKCLSCGDQWRDVFNYSHSEIKQ